MKLSLHWLKEFVNLEKVSPKKISESITLYTAELEEMIEVKKYFERVVTGKLLSRKPHPEAEKLSIAQFDCGSYGKKQIIFGQVHEVSEGEILPVALEGACLKSGIQIKNTDIRGEKSEGMIADNRELGMKNEGLMRFPQKTKLGIELPKLIPECADVLFDIDNKSLTHRPDLWGQEGFARELAAIFDKKLILKNPQGTLPQKGDTVDIQIKSDVCRRFCSIKMSGVKTTASDLGTQIRLENLGIRAISNLVDITNLILLELGQPMHIFDAAKVKGSLIVRQAKQGERLLALDGEEYELCPEDTVIADEEKVLSIAGIMGGEYSGVSEETSDVILECANWDPVSIRRTSTRLGLRSDSSLRYEKSLDPEICERALLSAVEYIQQCCPDARIKSLLTDQYPAPYHQTNILLNPQHVRNHSGLDISDQEIIEKLESIAFQVSKKKDMLQVDIPSFRATKDIAIAEDLIEEVVRLYGFEHIPSQLPSLPVEPAHKNHLRKLEWEIRDFFADQGFLEIYNYSFVDQNDAEWSEEKEYVTVENPLSSEHSQLRKNLISNSITNIESELRTHTSLKLFEIGKIYIPPQDPLPEEKTRFCVIQADMHTDENELFFALKEKISLFLAQKKLSFEFQPLEQSPSYTHPSKSANVLVNGEKVGILACLHPEAKPIASSIVFAEIDAEKLLILLRKNKTSYTPLSPFPPVRRDVSLIFDKKILMKSVEKVFQSASPLIRKVELFDEFEDIKKIGKNRKNMSFHLTFQSPEKTLSEKEIEAEFQKIIRQAEQKCGAKLRLEFDKAQ
ncbi:phenylalanine--tRNA ligase subunit beta [Candidatus Gracilibacteria bacterium]|nr:phenylalanine--tRNA ligase subunit beta [Candidatus Gracilibacteria bacterium]MCF7819355.1 phenylalanine--tRNA ligase subunit beta [Candidatus Gracilibacteria bacterium]